MHNRCAIWTSNLFRLLVRSVRSTNCTTVVHFIINQIAAAVSDRTISLRAFLTRGPSHGACLSTWVGTPSLSDLTLPPGFDPAAICCMMKCTTVVLFLLRTELTSNLIVCSGRKVPAILSAGVGLYENHLQMFCKEYAKCKCEPLHLHLPFTNHRRFLYVRIPIGKGGGPCVGRLASRQANGRNKKRRHSTTSNLVLLKLPCLR